jgi:hypothetical protein
MANGKTTVGMGKTRMKAGKGGQPGRMGAAETHGAPTPVRAHPEEGRGISHVSPVSARITVKVAAEGRTGVEMEAMTAAAVAPLTVYDMVKSAGKRIEIGPVRLLEKKGGKSGLWSRSEGAIERGATSGLI